MEKEQTNLKNKYKFITFEKETEDSRILSSKVKESEWIKPETILVNCFPEYSSSLCQRLNHSLSNLNKNELFEVINLPMPYPNMVQVWDTDEKNYKMFIKYLADWVRRFITLSDSFLFISTDSATSNLARVNAMIRCKIDSENYRFATLYKEKNNILTPNFWVEEYDETQGNIAFQWENLNNPNWN